MDSPEGPTEPPAQVRGTFGFDILVSFGFTLILTVASFANSVVIARLIGTEGRGLYALLTALVNVSWPPLSLGINHSATWLVGRGEDAGKVAGLVLAWAMVVGVVGLAIAAGLYLAGGGIPTDHTRLAVLGAALLLPAGMYNEGIRAWFLGLKNAVAFNLVTASSTFVLLGLNIWLLPRGSVWVVVTAVAAPWVPAIAIHTGLVVTRRVALPTFALFRRSASFGVKASVATMAEIALLRLDYLVIVPFITIEALGLYSTADQITHILAWGGLLAGRMMFAQSAADADGSRTRGKLGLACRLLIVVVGAAVLAADATCWYLIPLVFGEEFAPSALGVLVLGPAAILKGLFALVSTYLLGRNVIRPVVIAGVVAVAFDAVFAAIAAVTFGWIAVAAVKSAAYALQFAIVWGGYRSHVGDEPFRWIADREDFDALRRWAGPRLARFRR